MKVLTSVLMQFYWKESIRFKACEDQLELAKLLDFRGTNYWYKESLLHSSSWLGIQYFWLRTSTLFSKSYGKVKLFEIFICFSF